MSCDARADIVRDVLKSAHKVTLITRAVRTMIRKPSFSHCT